LCNSFDFGNRRWGISARYLVKGKMLCNAAASKMTFNFVGGWLYLLQKHFKRFTSILMEN